MPTEREYPSAVPVNDAVRVLALRALGVLDEPRRDELDALARIAAYICDAPTAAINLIDEQRQWSAAAYGFEAEECPRSEAMCDVSIRTPEVSYAADASTDPRWSGNPFVTGVRAEIRMYAAAPLVLAGGAIVGTVCAFADEPGALSRIQLERLRDVAGQAVRMLELRRATDELGHAATRDPLTGLPNRTLFAEALAHALGRYERGTEQPAVVCIDLDGFKAVNDRHGHGAGDELLRAVADRLLRTVRGSDMVARLGGDELVVLCEAARRGPGRGLAPFLTRLRAAFAAPFELSCGPVEVDASIGVAVASPGVTPADLMAEADAAMYRDKRSRVAQSA